MVMVLAMAEMDVTGREDKPGQLGIYQFTR